VKRLRNSLPSESVDMGSDITVLVDNTGVRLPGASEVDLTGGVPGSIGALLDPARVEAKEGKEGGQASRQRL
jgi:hypothetical protein